MSDLMNWFYAHYIRLHIESQPKSDGELLRFSFLESELDAEQQEDCQAALAFYAIQGFRLGLKTGLALGEDLAG